MQDKGFFGKVKELLKNKQVLFSVLLVVGMLIIAVLQFVFR